MIRKVIGIIMISAGGLGLIIEFSRTVSEYQTDFFGVGLALFFICIGGLLLSCKPGSRDKKTLVPEEDRTGEIKTKRVVPHHQKALDVISLAGFIISLFQMVFGLIITVVGGILMTALFSKGEPGWGVLGVGGLIWGVWLFLFGILRLVGYVHLKKRKFSGFVIVLICETMAFLGGVYSLILGQFFVAIFPLIWSAIVLVFLLRNRSVFFRSPASEGERNT